MRTCGSPCCPHCANYITRFHDIAFFNIYTTHVHKNAGDSLTVVNANYVTVNPETLRYSTYQRDSSRCWCNYG